MKKEQAYSLVPMERFGIKTVVLTQHESLDEIRDKFENDPDWTWCGGHGKKFMHQMLKKSLLAEDAYFDAHIDQAVNSNQRWSDFMDDCVLYAVLDSVINEAPMMLIHPSCVDNIRHPEMPPFTIKPTLIDGIEILH